MPDIFPRSNLPDDAVPWGRAHDTRVMALESGLEGVSQSVQGQNRNSASSLAVIAQQLQKLADQQAVLTAQQAQLTAQQASLTSQQATLTSTVNFLATQTVYNAKSVEYIYSGSNSGDSWFGFDPTYDCELTVQTGAAGKLLLQVTSNVLAGGRTTLMGIEIVGVTSPYVGSEFVTYLTGDTPIASGISRSVLASLGSNSSYTVRTRRGIRGSTAGVNGWSSTTLVATRS